MRWLFFFHLRPFRINFTLPDRPSSALRHCDVVEYSEVVLDVRRFPGVARVYSAPCLWDTHYQFSIKTLLSSVTHMVLTEPSTPSYYSSDLRVFTI